MWPRASSRARGNNADGAAALGRKDAVYDKHVLALRVETVNAIGKGPLLARLAETDADVVFAQEAKIARGEVPDVSAQLLKAGWKSMWAPAEETAASGKSAGVIV